MIGPCAREEPDEYSDGVSPTNEPIVLPVNRFQSPISTANANPVKVLDTSQARHPPHDRGELTVLGDVLDRRVQAPTPGLHRQHMVVVGIEGHPCRR